MAEGEVENDPGYGEQRAVNESTGMEVDEVEEDLDIVYKLLDTARTELLDEAMGANINRRHHLESAVACFESIGILFKAEQIIKEVLDLREGSEDPPEA